jgi:hypothetical protein
MTKNPNEILDLIEKSNNILFLKEISEMIEYLIVKVNNQLSYYNKDKFTFRKIKLLERKNDYEKLLNYLNKKITMLEKSEDSFNKFYN